MTVKGTKFVFHRLSFYTKSSHRQVMLIPFSKRPSFGLQYAANKTLKGRISRAQRSYITMPDAMT